MPIRGKAASLGFVAVELGTGAGEGNSVDAEFLAVTTCVNDFCPGLVVLLIQVADACLLSGTDRHHRPQLCSGVDAGL